MNAGRNDPCPCGSGRKYKKCCGAIIPIAAPQPANYSARRECGTCTACCDGWLEGTIRGHAMKPGVRCHFVRDGGCSIYDERPDSPCRSFTCAWMLPDSPLPESFRPDRIGVIVAPVKWRDRPALLLRSAGRDPDATVLGWMQQFSMRTGIPFFYEERGEKLGFGPPAFQMDMLQKAQRGEPMW